MALIIEEVEEELLGFLKCTLAVNLVYLRIIYIIKPTVCGFFFQVDRLSVCIYCSFTLPNLNRSLLSSGNYSLFVISSLS